jgi:16S rRNA (cytidine1402-2'-O)-methyltransferase
LRETLKAVDAVVPERRLAVCRELTKLHEEVFVGTAAAALNHFSEPRGEIVLVIEGGVGGALVTTEDDEATMRAEIVAMREAGLTRAQASALLGRRFRVSRRRVYELWLQGR